MHRLGRARARQAEIGFRLREAEPLDHPAEGCIASTLSIDRPRPLIVSISRSVRPE